MYFYQLFKKLILSFIAIAIFIIVLSAIIDGNVWTLTLMNIILAFAAWLFYRAYLDISEKKTAPSPTEISLKSPLDMNSFIEAQVFPTLVLDDDDTILHLNQSMVEAFDDGALADQKNLRIGQNFATLIRTPQVLDAYEQVKKNGQPIQFNFEQNYNGDRHYWVNISAANLTQGMAYIFTFRDLTKDQKTDRMRVDFVANASHELRTPLASISGFIETLQGPARDDAKVRGQFLTIMQEQADRMTRLIDDLLSLSKIEMNIHSKPRDEVDLYQIAEHVLDSAAPLAKDKNVKLKFEGLASSTLIRGDADQLIQLFGNLLDNAFKYGLRDDQENKIILRLSDHEQKNKIIVSIVDFGHGIPQTDLPRLTERFYRVSSQHTTKGTGLGLAIVKHILQRHNGEIQFKSEIDKGTKVEVTFHKLEL